MITLYHTRIKLTLLRAWHTFETVQLRLWLERAQVQESLPVICVSLPDFWDGDVCVCVLWGCGSPGLNFNPSYPSTRRSPEFIAGGLISQLWLFWGPSRSHERVSRDFGAEICTERIKPRQGTEHVWLFQQGWFLFKLWFYICFDIWIWSKARKEENL